MRANLLKFWIGIWMTCAGFAVAQDRPAVLLELFTSQGCSSCPAADTLFRDVLSKRSDLLTLSLHVDYWDYIGWKDSFAKRQFTTRQKTYAQRSGRKSVYTPQVIVNGQDHVVGSNATAIEDAIAQAAQTPSRAVLTVLKASRSITATLKAHAAGTGGAVDVLAFYYKPQGKVAIQAGENAGQTLTYSNVVVEITPLGVWNGKGVWSKTFQRRTDTQVVVVAQQANHGAVLAAARAR